MLIKYGDAQPITEIMTAEGGVINCEKCGENINNLKINASEVVSKCDCEIESEVNND